MAKRILFVSELGAGAGHLAPLLSIAEKICESAPETIISFAVSNPGYAYAMFAGKGFAFTPCPARLGPSASSSSNTGSYYEVLAYLNFHRRDQLAASLAAWDALLDLHKPDVIVADHSPTLCLAARGRVPLVLVGNGYTLPPSHLDTYPALLPEIAEPRAQGIMLDEINALLGNRGQPTLRALPDVCSVSLRGLFAIPETDVYGNLRRDQFLGGYDSGISKMEPNMDGGIFLYCSLHPDKLGQVVQACVATGKPLEAYIGPFDGPEKHFLQGFGVMVHHEMPSLSHVLERSSVVVSTGGAGLTVAALTAGRTHVCLPAHIESSFNAQAVEDLNCGARVNLEDELHELEDVLRNVVEVQSYARNAQSVAGRISSYNLPSDPVGHVATGVLALG